jgi:hypothetical protein
MMNLTFDEIHADVLSRLSGSSAWAFKAPGVWSPRQVLKQALLEIGPDDMQQLCARQGWLKNKLAVKRLRNRVVKRCKAEYSNPLLIFLLVTALGELICLAIEWIWNKFVKDSGTSLWKELQLVSDLAPELNAIGRRAAA